MVFLAADRVPQFGYICCGGKGEDPLDVLVAMVVEEIDVLVGCPAMNEKAVPGGVKPGAALVLEELSWKDIYARYTTPAITPA